MHLVGFSCPRTGGEGARDEMEENDWDKNNHLIPRALGDPLVVRSIPLLAPTLLGQTHWLVD